MLWRSTICWVQILFLLPFNSLEKLPNRQSCQSRNNASYITGHYHVKCRPPNGTYYKASRYHYQNCYKESLPKSHGYLQMFINSNTTKKVKVYWDYQKCRLLGSIDTRPQTNFIADSVCKSSIFRTSILLSSRQVSCIRWTPWFSSGVLAPSAATVC